MFKKLRNFMLANLGVMLTFVAGLGLSSKCMWTMYEPDIPDCLRR